MSKILPFRAVRPSADEAMEIAALPYDVYNRKEACAEVARHPGSFLAIDRAETQFDDSVSTYDECVYAKAAELLNEWQANGRFIQDDKPCYYIYELIMDGRSQSGIVACASIDDYEQGIIKKHENTRAEKEADRIHHVDTCNAQTGPIFLAYRANDVLSAEIAKAKAKTPIYDLVTEDGIAHRCWIIDEDASIDAIRTAFETIDSIYIADGHHRCASAVKVGQKRRAENPGYTGTEEFNYFLSVLFVDTELKIMDYNRVVKDLNGYSAADLLSKIKQIVDVKGISKEAIKPSKKGEFSLYLDGAWYECAFKTADLSNDPVEGLDVSLLQKLVLTPVLGIGDPKTDSRIDFVGGIRGLKELEKRCSEDCKVAFAMYPTDIHELFDVADASLLMPPKSTWFEPKLRSGLFIHKL